MLYVNFLVAFAFLNNFSDFINAHQYIFSEPYFGVNLSKLCEMVLCVNHLPLFLRNIFMHLLKADFSLQMLVDYETYYKQPLNNVEMYINIHGFLPPKSDLTPEKLLDVLINIAKRFPEDLIDKDRSISETSKN